MIIKVETKNAPAAIGPYSQAVVMGNLVFTSGQIPLNPETGELVGETIAEQTHQVCKNLKAVVEAAGTSMEKVVKTVCFLADINDFAKFNVRVEILPIGCISTSRSATAFL